MNPQALAKEIITLTGYDTIDKLKAKMGSKKGKDITKIEVVIDIKDKDDATPSSKTITTQAYAGTEKVVKGLSELQDKLQKAMQRKL